MKLYIKQKAFSLRNEFKIKNEQDEIVYKVAGKVIDLGKHLRVTDPETGDLLIEIYQISGIRPRVEISRNGNVLGRISMSEGRIQRRVKTEFLGFKIEGNIFAHDYKMVDSNSDILAEVRKKSFSFGDSYELDVLIEDYDTPLLVATALAIDMLDEIVDELEEDREKGGTKIKLGNFKFRLGEE